MATRTIFENHNTHPSTGRWIFYRMKKGAGIVEVSMDNEQTWVEVHTQTTLYTESEFARWVYGFKAGLGFGN